jgi:predicted nucleic acid-binding protein
MAGDQYLVDSNVLIRWSQPGDPGYLAADASLIQLERIQADLCYTSQNLGEFWNSLTRPANRNGYGQSVQEANRCALAIESRLKLLPDTVAIHHEWRRLIVEFRVCGAQVHDARLVAAMTVHGVKRILTFNTRDFARFTNIEAIHPLDFSNQAPAE